MVFLEKGIEVWVLLRLWEMGMFWRGLDKFLWMY